MRFLPADICLPDFHTVDAEKWAVIACDQFTSEPEYWEACDAFVGAAPSALRLVFPEVWLSPDNAPRIAAINRAMHAYEGGVLRTLGQPGYVYLERTQPDGRVRCGLVGMIDLEDYDYAPDAKTPIRATEGTVLSRIPPRVAIRRDALYELPHVMLLADDPEDRLLAPYAGGAALAPLYDTPLMMGGGHLRGWAVPKSEERRIEAVLSALSPSSEDKAPFTLAVGDGNHSLATAKKIYEEMKQNDPQVAKTSPARYALVEVTNLHSPALDFSPIYRLIVDCEPEQVADAFAEWGTKVGRDPANARLPQQTFHLLWAGGERELTLPHGLHPLAVGTVQAFLDGRPDLSIDYIHDESSLAALAKKPGALGILFDGMKKQDLFPAVASGGSLPRKTFSMGHARDKRYYMEARKIK